MNKDEIKKALKCCEKYERCLDCPCCTYCTHDLLNDALGLITEQEQEIDRLKAANERFENNMKNILEIEKRQAQIDVLNELKEKKSMNKHYANIEALKASLSQSGPTYSPERLQADIRSLSSTMTIWDIDEMIEDVKRNDD